MHGCERQLNPLNYGQAGYREAIEEGKARTLQHGFNIGQSVGMRSPCLTALPHLTLHQASRKAFKRE